MGTSGTKQFVYGYCLYMSWASSVLMIISGAAMLVGSIGESEGEDERDEFTMAPSRPFLGKSQNGYV